MQFFSETMKQSRKSDLDAHAFSIQVDDSFEVSETLVPLAAESNERRKSTEKINCMSKCYGNLRSLNESMPN